MNDLLIIPEGATPIDDLSDLKLPWITTRQQQNLTEAENILGAFSKYFARKRNPVSWLNEKSLQKIHRDMFGTLWQWAGKYRTHVTNIGVQPHLITMQLNELCDDVHFWIREKSSFPLIEQSVRIHHRLVAIHPFVNGNGRHARFVADLFLYCQGLSIAKWPQDLGQNGLLRKEYISALKEADQGDYCPLLSLTERYRANGS